jgi:uncharacterized membrane protein
VRPVWVATVLFAVIVSALATDRYVTYHYGADLGLYTQTIYTAFHGFYNQVEHGTHFMVHFSPIYWLCAPILLVIPSPMTLQALQAIGCALIAPPIYLFARKRVDHRLALTIAVVALLYPPLVGMSLSEFHENAFAPAAIAWLLWAVDERRWPAAAIFAVLALCIKEDEAVILAVLGAGYAVYALTQRDRPAAIFGLCVALAAIAVLALYFGVIQPATGGRWFVADFYLAHNADLPHGAAIIVGRLTFLLEVFVPLLFLPFASRVLWLVVPGFIEVLSSRWPVTYTMGTHYAGVWIAYVLVAFAAALGGIARRDTNRALLLARASIAVCLFNLIVSSPTHWAHYYRLRNTHDAVLDRIIAQVPSESLAASYDEAYTHMSLNPLARIGMYVTPEYFVYDSTYDQSTYLTNIVPRLAAVVCTGYFIPVAGDDGVVLYKRVRDVPESVYAQARRKPPHCPLSQTQK